MFLKWKSRSQQGPSIASFRQQRRTTKLRPYELISGLGIRAPLQEAAHQIIREGWQRASNYPHVSLTPPLPWDETAQVHRSWSFHMHCWDPINVLLAAHSELNDQVCLDAALIVGLDWVDRFTSGETSSQFAWYDMAVGVRAYRLAYLLDAISREVRYSDEVVGKLFSTLLMHEERLRDDTEFKSHNNHGFYQAFGQLAMASRLSELPGMKEAHTQALSRMRQMFGQQFNGEGMHLEHSPDYHRMVYETLDSILKSNLIDDEEILAQRDRIAEAFTWFVQPNGKLATFGDSDYRSVIQKYRVDTPAADRGETFRIFKDAGFAVVRDRWPRSTDDTDCSYLAQIAAFHSRTHKHADDLSFIWYDRGHEILIDTGRYGYTGEKPPADSELFQMGFWYSDPRRVYAESTCAHNTVEIDSKPYQRRGVKPYGSAIERWGESGPLRFIETHVRQAPSVRHARTLVYYPREWLLVYDWLWCNKKEPHKYTQWFHFAPELDVAIDSGRLRVGLPSGDTLWGVSLLNGSTLRDPIRGQTEPALQGWWSPGIEQLEPNWAAAWEVEAVPTHSFGTLFAFGREVLSDLDFGRASQSGRASSFRWRTDGQVNTLHLSRPLDGPLGVKWNKGS